MAEYRFYEPLCSQCEHHRLIGIDRYCAGFSKRKSKRFKASDAKIHPPKWCPKRLNPPVISIFRRKESEVALIKNDLAEAYSKTSRYAVLSKSDYNSTPAHQYTEYTTARQIFNLIKKDHRVELDNFALLHGDVIEIDIGMRQYLIAFLGSDQKSGNWVGCKPAMLI